MFPFHQKSKKNMNEPFFLWGLGGSSPPGEKKRGKGKERKKKRQWPQAHHFFNIFNHDFCSQQITKKGTVWPQHPASAPVCGRTQIATNHTTTSAKRCVQATQEHLLQCRHNLHSQVM